jgi:hypothetical protein
MHALSAQDGDIRRRGRFISQAVGQPELAAEREIEVGPARPSGRPAGLMRGCFRPGRGARDSGSRRTYCRAGVSSGPPGFRAALAVDLLVRGLAGSRCTVAHTLGRLHCTSLQCNECNDCNDSRGARQGKRRAR